ncbi:YiiX/YebB-like N1pC/P60 family cysteine hydrolase [Mariniflexile jejuense]|uniref:YiiX/YebB-like N1pC/P60 family cysteine hydrolase n=1 Tax=Mariniflexile jejuense TaxID=1173582 RepID=A0ABW3JFC9_9FLAO
MKYSLCFLLLVFGLKTHSQRIALKNGDLMFQSINCGPLCDAINQVTEGYRGLDFNHMGMVVIKDNNVYVLEASGSEVKLTNYDDFVKKTNLPLYVGRLKKRYQALIPKAITFGLQQLGKPYDEAYIYDNGKYYCSELIYDCFLEANGTPLFKLYPMTYKSPGADIYFEVWESYFKALGMDVPEGELGCNPGGISKSRKLKMLGEI